MKQMIGAVLACLLAGWLFPTSAYAQLGSIIDRLQKMSGPEMQYYGVAYRFGYQPGQFLENGLLYTIQTDRLPPVYATLADDCSRATHRQISERGGRAIAYEERLVDRARYAGSRARGLLESANADAMDIMSDDMALAIVHAQCHQRDLVQRAIQNPDPQSGVVGRMGVYYGTDTRDDLRPDVGTSAWMLQTTVEYQFGLSASQDAPDFGLEAGVASHIFLSRSYEDFLHVTFPIKLNFHPFASCRGWLWRNFRAGTGVHVVPPFTSLQHDPFGGAYGSLDTWEVTWLKFFIAFDISDYSWRGNPMAAC